MSTMAKLSYFLRLQINKQGYSCASNYTRDFLLHFGMENCKPIMTPMGAASTLDLDEDGEPVAQKECRSVIGSLYLTVRHSIFFVSMCPF